MMHNFLYGLSFAAIVVFAGAAGIKLGRALYGAIMRPWM